MKHASKTQMMSMLSFFALLDNHYYPRALVGIDTFAKCERNFTKRDKFGQFWGLFWATAGNFKAKLSIVQCKNLSLDYENFTAFASATVIAVKLIFVVSYTDRPILCMTFPEML